MRIDPLALRDLMLRGKNLNNKYMGFSKSYLAREAKEPAKSKMTAKELKHEKSESKTKEAKEHAGGGKSSQKKPFSTAKAKTILKEKNPTLKGNPITSKQRGLLGLIAGGKTPTKKKGFKG